MCFSQDSSRRAHVKPKPDLSLLISLRPRLSPPPHITTPREGRDGDQMASAFPRFPAIDQAPPDYSWPASCVVAGLPVSLGPAIDPDEKGIGFGNRPADGRRDTVGNKDRTNNAEA